MIGRETQRKRHVLSVTAAFLSVLLALSLSASLSSADSAGDSQSPFPSDGIPANIDVNSIDAIPLNPNETHVYFLNPEDGSVVSGVIRIDGMATGGNISSVSVKVDNGEWEEAWNITEVNISIPVPQASLLTTDFTYVWNTSQSSDGKHIIYARAYSEMGGFSKIKTLNLTVQNGAPQTQENMWLWLGVGFVIGGGLIGAAGIFLRKRRIAVEKAGIEPQHTKTS